MKNMPLTIILAIIMGAAIIITVGVIYPLYQRAGDMGKDSGEAVGKAIGSFDGVNKGYREGYEIGKQEGISAGDTNAEIKNKPLGTGKLQVLSVNVRMDNFHSISSDYAALYITKGKAIYTVDLSDVQVIYDKENSVSIIFPEPEVKLTSTEQPTKIFETQKFWFSGDSRSGAEALVNSLNNVDEKNNEAFADYDELMEQAIKSAKKQITELAKNARLNNNNFTVECAKKNSEVD